MTVSSSPTVFIALRNPSAIDSTPTNTMTTPVMPITATADDPARSRSDRRLTLVTAMI